MNELIHRQSEIQNEMAALSGCRAQIFDVYVKNPNGELQVAMNAVLDRLKNAEKN